VNFTKIYPRFGFADVTHKADMRICWKSEPSENCWGCCSRPIGWEPLLYSLFDWSTTIQRFSSACT